MNIVIGLSVIISAIILKRNYKVNGKVSGKIFSICIAAGVFMLFSVQTFDSALLIAMTVAEVVLCALLVAVYRAQLIREREAVRRRRAARRASMEKASEAQTAVRKRYVLTAA